MSTSLSNSFVIVSQRLVTEENDGLPADLSPLQKVSGVLRKEHSQSPISSSGEYTLKNKHPIAASQEATKP